MKYNKIYGKTVLVADDVEINRKIITKLISALGGKAVCATNGHDAVKLFKVSSEGEYSIVLMDICMPIMNGYEASAAIRMSEHPDAKNIPIIAISSEKHEDVNSLCLKAGMNLHMEKPFSPDRLIEELEKL